MSRIPLKALRPWRAVGLVALLVALAGGSAAGQAGPAETSTSAPPDPALAGLKRGTLAVRAVQGTKDAKTVSGAEVEIDMVLGNRSIQHYSAKMDDQALVMLGDVPVGPGVRPLVRIKYAGVTYQEAGPEMNEARPQASMAVTVFETTEQAPSWRVSMRHMIAIPGPQGFDVSETVVVENPADRTWIGGTPDAAGKRPVVRVSLPAGAQTVQLDAGFHGWCCTKLDADELTVQMPLMPGQSTFKYSYRVPVSGGRADLKVRSVAPIDHAVFFVPEDVATTPSGGVVEGGVQSMGALRMKMLQGANIAAGSDVGVIVQTRSSDASPPPAGPTGGGWIAPFAGGMGLMLVIGVGVAARYMRRPRGHAARRIVES